MLGYITFVALFNLGLGYSLAVYLHGGERRTLRQIVADLRTPRSQETDPAPAETESPSNADRPQRSTDDKRKTRAEEAPQVPAARPTVSEPARAAAKSGVRTTGLVTLDYVDQLLTQLTADGKISDTPVSVVLMELDPVDAKHAVSSDRLLAGVAETVHGLLEEAHTAARFTDQRFFLLLPGDDESQATQRAEQVRQRIEATEFVADDQRIHATVTCALAQVASGSMTTQLMDTLQAALTRAKNLGGNRTYMFDGLAPAPVVPPELNLAPQKCAI